MASRVMLALLIPLALVIPGWSGAEEPQWQLPNLRPLPAHDFEIGPPEFPNVGERALKFTTSSLNVGAYALDLDGLEPRDLQRGVFRALQCVRWAAPHVCAERADTGDLFFESHTDHLHWHYAAFASYELRRLVDGNVDETPAGLLATARKISFCMQDTDPIEQSTLVERFTRNPPFYLTCAGFIQGISPGWRDDYGPGLSGQEIVIDGVADGEYVVKITLNAGGQLLEDTLEDNSSYAHVVIAGSTAIPGSAAVV